MILNSHSCQTATLLSMATVITVTAFNAPLSLAQISSRGNFISINSLNNEGWAESALLRTLQLGSSGSSVISADGQTVANGSWNKTLNNWTIQAWNPTTGELKRTLKGADRRQPNPGQPIAIDAKGEILVSILGPFKVSNPTSTLKIWNLLTGQLIRSLEPLSMSAVALSPEGQTLAVSSKFGEAKIQIWDLKTGKLQKTLNGNADWVPLMVFSPDGQTLLSNVYDKDLLKSQIWDLKTGLQIRPIPAYSDSLSGLAYSLAYSRDGKTVARSSSDGRVKVLNLRTGELVQTIDGHPIGVSSIAFSPDKLTLATHGPDQRVKLWDLQTGQLLRIIHSHSMKVDRIQLRSLKTGQLLRTLVNPDSRDPLKLSRPNTIVFSADGEKLASGDFNGTIQLWNPRTGALLRTLPGNYLTGISAVSFSPDGERLASISGASETIQLWNLKTGERMRSLVGHEYAVTAIAFGPDGQTLISGSADKTVKIWQMSP